MEIKNYYPMILSPIFKNHIWGGDWEDHYMANALDHTIFKKRVGESWQIVDLEKDSSLISNGLYKGKSLREILRDENHARNILGEEKKEGNFFPLLLKIINPRLPLSVQVHPADGDIVSGQVMKGKEEAWLVLDIDQQIKDQAKIFLGFKKGVDLNHVKEAIKNDSLLDLLNVFYPKKGDLFHILPGTIHALGGGVRVLEIQQSSNTTYRLYDYNRVDDKGFKRELHLESALQVLRYDNSGRLGEMRSASDESGNIQFQLTNGLECLVDGNYFKMGRFIIDKNRIFEADTREKKFHLCHFQRSDLTRKIIYKNSFLEVKGVATVLIPSQLGNYQVIGEVEESSYLFTT